jgi:hypothetical protein
MERLSRRLLPKIPPAEREVYIENPSQRWGLWADIPNSDTYLSPSSTKTPVR